MPKVVAVASFFSRLILKRYSEYSQDSAWYRLKHTLLARKARYSLTDISLVMKDSSRSVSKLKLWAHRHCSLATSGIPIGRKLSCIFRAASFLEDVCSSRLDVVLRGTRIPSLPSSVHLAICTMPYSIRHRWLEMFVIV
jgi:hypothetical protein